MTRFCATKDIDLYRTRNEPQHSMDVRSRHNSFLLHQGRCMKPKWRADNHVIIVSMYFRRVQSRGSRHSCLYPLAKSNLYIRHTLPRSFTLCDIKSTVGYGTFTGFPIYSFMGTSSLIDIS